MIKIAICDDSVSAVEIVEQYMERLPKGDFEYEVFYKAADLLSYMQKNDLTFDAYLLDIEMPEMNGMTLAGKIRAMDSQAVLIFQTSHSECVFESFKLGTHRFLIKPVLFDEFAEALESIKVYFGDKKQRFQFSYAKETYSIPCQDIVYFEKEQRKVRIHTQKEIYESYMKMKEVLVQLDLNVFTTVSASYVINLRFIKQIKRDTIITDTEVHLPISKRYRKLVKDKHLQYEMVRF